MAISRLQSPKSAWLLLVLVSACASSPEQNTVQVEMPNEWLVQKVGGQDDCSPIDGEYSFYGHSKLGPGSSLTKTRLDVTLGYYVVQSDSEPPTVTLAYDEQDGMLEVGFDAPTNQTHSIKVRCLDGWWKYQRVMTNEYVGDGTTLDFEKRQIELAKSAEGALIIHLKLDTQTSALLFFKNHRQLESWSRFPRIAK